MPARDLSRWTQTESGTWRYTPNQPVAQPKKAKAEVEEPADEGYAGMTKAELEELLVSKELPKSGTKDELIARLEEADAA